MYVTNGHHKTHYKTTTKMLAHTKYGVYKLINTFHWHITVSHIWLLTSKQAINILWCTDQRFSESLTMLLSGIIPLNILDVGLKFFVKHLLLLKAAYIVMLLYHTANGEKNICIWHTKSYRNVSQYSQRMCICHQTILSGVDYTIVFQWMHVIPH